MRRSAVAHLGHGDTGLRRYRTVSLEYARVHTKLRLLELIGVADEPADVVIARARRFGQYEAEQSTRAGLGRRKGQAALDERRLKSGGKRDQGRQFMWLGFGHPINRMWRTAPAAAPAE